MGITYVTFSKIYNYGIIPKFKVLIRIADYFDISVEYLLCMTEEVYFKKSNSPKTFGFRLNELRKENNYTIYKLSELLHIHRNNIAQWIKNDYIPSINDLEIIADFFNVSLDYLLGRTDEK